MAGVGDLAAMAQGSMGIPQGGVMPGSGGGLEEILSQLTSGQLSPEKLLMLLALLSGGAGMGAMPPSPPPPGMAGPAGPAGPGGSPIEAAMMGGPGGPPEQEPLY